MTLGFSDPGIHCPRSSDLAIHAWADGVVVYDDANGSLHALSPAAGEALTQLLTLESTNAVSLARILVQEEPSEKDVTMVNDLIGEFISMGFVEPIAE